MKNFKYFVENKNHLKSEENTGHTTKVLDFLANSFNASIEDREYDSVYGTGDKALLVFQEKNIALQISIREDSTGIYLVSIAVKKYNDLSQIEKASGIGSKTLELLKEYSDKNNKPFAVVGSTLIAAAFYKKFKWLKEESVYLYMGDDVGYVSSADENNKAIDFVYYP